MPCRSWPTCLVIFVLGPLIVLTGLTMSPTMDSAFPLFLVCSAAAKARAPFISFVPSPFSGFFIIHIAMVILSGTWNNLRSMITGWYVDRRRGTAMTDLVVSGANFSAARLAGLSPPCCCRLLRSFAKALVHRLLGEVENLTRRAQHLFAGPHTLAPEFTKADIAPVFRANGTLDPGTPEYKAHAATGFRDWRVTVSGLVDQPVSLSMDRIRKLPQRTQITRHDCVEGWSCIGEWSGPQLALILAAARAEAECPLCHVLLRRSDDGRR